MSITENALAGREEQRPAGLPRQLADLFSRDGGRIAAAAHAAGQGGHHAWLH